MLIADVKITLASRVLGDTGKLQSQVAELNGVSLRYVLDVPLSEFIGTGASLRQDLIVTPLVEVLGLLDDLTIGRSLDLFLVGAAGGGGLRTTWLGGGLRRSIGAATRVSGSTVVPGGCACTAGVDGVGACAGCWAGAGVVELCGVGEDCAEGEALGCGAAVADGGCDVSFWASAGAP